MNVEIITPAGRERYLKILLVYVKKLHELGKISRWQIWVNTENKSDIDYMKSIAADHEFIKLHYLDIPYMHNLSIHSFFKHAMDENTIYVRFDDDIVYVDIDGFDNFIKFRVDNPQYFLVYGNIINNALITHIHQRFGNTSFNYGVSGYGCLDEVGWKTPKFCEELHNGFLNSIKDGTVEKFKFNQWILHHYERCSINCFAFFGKEFKKFNGEVEEDEELFLSVLKPERLGRCSTIYGGFIVSHYSFFTQREYMDTTDVLKKYEELSKCLHM